MTVQRDVLRLGEYHPSKYAVVVLPQVAPRSSTRLRLRRGVAFLYMAALPLVAVLLTASSVRLAGAAGVLLFLDICLIASFRKPFDPLLAIRRKGAVL